MVRISVLIILMLLVDLGYGATNRYLIYFINKTNNSYSLDHPRSFMSEKALERREVQGLALDSTDLPVSEYYLNALQSREFKVFFSSKWLNAALIECDSERLDELNNFKFVSKVTFMAPGHRLSQTPEKLEYTYTNETPLVVSKSADFQLESIGVDIMQSEGFTGSGVTVAVLDAGFKGTNRSLLFEHLFENDRILDSYDFVRNERNPFAHDDHGTNVLSCLVAKHKYLTGSAVDVSVALYVTEDPASEYRIEELNWLLAAERADSLGIDIISSSLGYNTFDDSSMDHLYTETTGDKTIISNAAQYASDKGILVINSAGNEGNNNEWPYVIFPSDVQDVLVVGAVDSELKYASFSSRGPTADERIKPDVVALGRYVTLYLENNKIDRRSGTSYSTPLIVGLAAGLWQKYPSLTNMELKQLIVTSGSSYIKPNTKTGYGVPSYSRIGMNTALSVDKVMTDDMIVYPNPFNSNYINVKIEREYAQEDIQFIVYGPSGNMVNKHELSQTKRTSEFRMEIGGMEKGVYLLIVKTASASKKVKLLRY